MLQTFYLLHTINFSKQLEAFQATVKEVFRGTAFHLTGKCSAVVEIATI